MPVLDAADPAGLLTDVFPVTFREDAVPLLLLDVEVEATTGFFTVVVVVLVDALLLLPFFRAAKNDISERFDSLSGRQPASRRIIWQGVKLGRLM